MRTLDIHFLAGRPAERERTRTVLILPLAALITLSCGLRQVISQTNSVWHGMSVVLSTASPTVVATATPYPTYPTDYPPGKQTSEASVRQTQETARLTPFPTSAPTATPAIQFVQVSP